MFFSFSVNLQDTISVYEKGQLMTIIIIRRLSGQDSRFRRIPRVSRIGKL